MANVINYAQKWQKELIKYIQSDILTAEHIVSTVKWLNAQTFNFTISSTSGYGDHVRTGGWNSGTVTQTNVPYVVSHDRDIEFLVDQADVDESDTTASANNITNTFMEQNQNPETDAYFFSKVVSDPGAVVTQDEVVGGAWTSTTVVTKLKALIKPLRRYGVNEVRGYLSSDIMELLELADDFNKDINIQSVSGADGQVLETRVTSLDGVKLIEVYDADRFYDIFNFTTGFVPTVGVSRPINALFCTLSHTVTVPKIASIYLFGPGEHTKGDGYLYQNRALWDTFTFPNAKGAAVDSITASTGVLLT